MTKKEIQKIVTLCSQGVTFKRAVEIILRVELQKDSSIYFDDKKISRIAESICQLDEATQKKEN
jgi:hypothetical protein